MKILQLITRAEAGGAQVHVLDLLSGLASHGDVSLATGEEGFLSAAARKLGIKVHILNHLVQPVSPGTDLRGVQEIARLLRRERPDIVHAHTSKAGTIGRIAAKLAGVPSVFTSHSWAFSEGTSWKWKLVGIPTEFAAALCTSRIINVSEANRLLARRYRVGSESQHVTVHNGIPDSPHQADPGAPEECRVLMVARFAPQKDQISLIRALAEVEVPCRLLFAGGGPTLDTAKSETSRLGLNRRISFLGERFDIAELLASAHVFALTSHYEGFPISILEAMRAGLPVLASNVGGNHEAIENGVSGHLVPPGDHAMLVHRLRQLALDPALRARMGAASRRAFLARFHRDGMVAKTLAVYRSVLSPAPMIYPIPSPERTDS